LKVKEWGPDFAPETRLRALGFADKFGDFSFRQVEKELKYVIL